MKIVEYLKHDRTQHCMYNKGEIAGWPDHIADRLIALGFREIARRWQATP